MREFTIYHNPDCGTSRNVLTMLRQSGIEPVVIEYLKTPPDRATLASLIASMGMTARGLLRVKGTPYGELGLDDPKWTVDDLIDPNLVLLRFRLPAGDTVGYGGFERHGDAALLRSIVVLPAYRGSGIGRNLMLLLMRRAFDAGAQQGYALTTDADDWLEKLGFKRLDRAQAPEEILRTRQATQLCPSHARIWSRSLRP